MKRMHILCWFLLLFSAHGWAQTDALSAIEARMSAGNNLLVPEKLYVHTDKEFYTAGEILWFKIYAVDGISNKPLMLSTVGFVELLDNNKVPVSRIKVAMSEKGGSGSIQLPLSLNTGNYSLIAYTSWMKNLGPESYFHKSIAIANTLKTTETSQMPVSSYTLNLFPEGGNLVYGLPSKVAFHLTDKFGKGITAKGYLVNQRNDTLSMLSTYKFGMGSFDLSPQRGQTYRAVFLLPDGSFIARSLPEVYDSGYVMGVEEISGEKLKITVATSVRSSYPEIFLLAQSGLNVKASQRAIVQNGIASFYLNLDDLDDGVSKLTIFNSEKKPVCERLFFIPPSEPATFQLSTDQKSYGSRKKVSVDVNELLSSSPSLSLSVHQADSLQIRGTDILSYLRLTADVTGIVEDPQFYFSGSGTEVKRTADYLMLTHGWRRFDWKTLLNTAPVVKFAAENTGQIIRARVTDLRTNTPARAVQVFLSIPQAWYKLYSSQTNEDGIANFVVQDYYGSSEIVLQAKGDSSYKIEVLSPFDESHFPYSLSYLQLNRDKKNLLVNNSISMQAQHVYLSDRITQFAARIVTDTFPFFGQPLHTYKLDDYKRFSTMEEVLREYVREISVGVKGSGSTLRVKLFNQDRRQFYNENILVLIDGIPLQNPNLIFAFDPLKIKTLEIIPKNYVIGSSIFNALASFTSYDGNFQNFQLDERAVTVDYEGLQLQREFYSPEYASAQQYESRIPDLRTTLFWSADVSSNKIEFYTSDNKGNYLIVLQGITKEGKIINSSTQFSVE